MMQNQKDQHQPKSLEQISSHLDYPVDKLQLHRGYDRIKSLIEIFIKIDQRERICNENNRNQHNSSETK